MLLLSIIPTSLLIWVINAVLLVGIVGTIAGFFIKFIPLVNTYRLLIQIVSIVLLVIGVYWKGGYGVELEWRARVAQAEEKVRIAEQRAAEANAEIKIKVVEKIKIVKEQQLVYRDRIIEKEKIIDAECKVAPEALDILNQAAKTPGESK
jgi:hypothetical protein